MANNLPTTTAQERHDNLHAGNTVWVETDHYVIDVKSDQQWVVYDGVRSGHEENAFCDGENPSGLGSVHSRSPYITGEWPTYENGVGFIDAEGSFNKILEDRDLDTICLGFDDAGSKTCRVLLGVCPTDMVAEMTARLVE